MSDEGPGAMSAVDSGPRAPSGRARSCWCEPAVIRISSGDRLAALVGVEEFVCGRPPVGDADDSRSWRVH